MTVAQAFQSSKQTASNLPLCMITSFQQDGIRYHITLIACFLSFLGCDGSGVVRKGLLSEVPQIADIVSNPKNNKSYFIHYNSGHRARVAAIISFDPEVDVNIHGLLPFLEDAVPYTGADTILGRIPDELLAECPTVSFDPTDVFWIKPVAGLETQRKYSVYCARSIKSKIIYLDYSWGI